MGTVAAGHGGSLSGLAERAARMRDMEERMESIGRFWKSSHLRYSRTPAAPFVGMEDSRWLVVFKAFDVLSSMVFAGSVVALICRFLRISSGSASGTVECSTHIFMNILPRAPGYLLRGCLESGACLRRFWLRDLPQQKLEFNA